MFGAKKTSNMSRGEFVARLIVGMVGLVAGAVALTIAITMGDMFNATLVAIAWFGGVVWTTSMFVGVSR